MAATEVCSPQPLAEVPRSYFSGAAFQPVSAENTVTAYVCQQAVIRKQKHCSPQPQYGVNSLIGDFW